MPKLLVNAPNGLQELIEIERSGSYFDDSRVLWDERKDGPFSSDLVPKIGGLKRVDKDLVVDEEMLAAAIAKVATADAKEQQRKNRIQAARLAIKNIDENTDFTTAEIKAILRALVFLARNS